MSIDTHSWAGIATWPLSSSATCTLCGSVCSCLQVSHRWSSLLRRRAASLWLVSFNEDARPLGGCGWRRLGRPELLALLGWAEVGEEVGFDTMFRPGILVPLSEFSFARLLSSWWPAAEEARLPGLRNLGVTGKLPLSLVSSRSCSLAWLKASVSSKRSSHSLRTVSWRKVFWNEKKGGKASLALYGVPTDSPLQYKQNWTGNQRSGFFDYLCGYSATWDRKVKNANDLWSWKELEENIHLTLAVCRWGTKS